MKRLLFLLSFIALTASSFAQFTDTAQYFDYVRNTIKDRRPDKVTAAQIQEAFLGLHSFIGGSNIYNSDGAFSGYRNISFNSYGLAFSGTGHIAGDFNDGDSIYNRVGINDTVPSGDLQAFTISASFRQNGVFIDSSSTYVSYSGFTTMAWGSSPGHSDILNQWNYSGLMSSDDGSHETVIDAQPLKAEMWTTGTGTQGNVEVDSSRVALWTSAIGVENGHITIEDGGISLSSTSYNDMYAQNHEVHLTVAGGGFELYSMPLTGTGGSRFAGDGVNAYMTADNLYFTYNNGFSIKQGTTNIVTANSTLFNILMTLKVPKLIASYSNTFPTSATGSSEDVGTFAFDDSYLYIRTTSGMKRVALSAF